MVMRRIIPRCRIFTEKLEPAQSLHPVARGQEQVAPDLRSIRSPRPSSPHVMLVRVLFGTNPWPGAGRLGHVAMAIMTFETASFLAAFAFALYGGQTVLLGTDFFAFFTG